MTLNLAIQRLIATPLWLKAIIAFGIFQAINSPRVSTPPTFDISMVLVPIALIGGFLFIRDRNISLRFKSRRLRLEADEAEAKTIQFGNFKF